MGIITVKTDSKELICKNCENPFHGKYCNHCGQKFIERRNTLKHFFHLLFNSLDLQKGLLFTIKLLFINPGKLINQYLNGRTKDFINPLKYLFIIIGVSTIITLWTNVFDTSISNTNELLGVPEESLGFQTKIITFLKKYLNIFTIFFIPFYSLISKWVLKKHKQYYAEHLIINSYLYAQFALINLIPLAIVILFPRLIVYSQFFGIIIFVSYYTYALRSIYKLKIITSFFKSLLINILGLLLMMLVLMTIMITIILILKLSGANLETMFS